MRSTVLLSYFLLVCDQLTYVRSAEKTANRFLVLADAAFPRTCVNDFSAVQRISPNQPFKWNIESDLLPVAPSFITSLCNATESVPI